MADPWTIRRSHATFDLRFTDHPAEIGEEETETIIADLAAAMPGVAVRELFARWPGLLQLHHALTMAYEPGGGRAVGMAGFQQLDSAFGLIQYFRTILVSERFHGSGLAPALLMWAPLCMYEEGVPGPLLWVTKSSNPLVHRILMRTARVVPEARVYPDCEREQQDPEMMRMAGEIAAMLCPTLEFDAPHGVILGAQTFVCPNLFAVRPRCSEAAINGYFDRHVTPSDQLLSVGHAPPECWPQIRQLLHAVVESA